MNSNLINKAIKWGGIALGAVGIAAAALLRVEDEPAEDNEMIEGEFTDVNEEVIEEVTE